MDTIIMDYLLKQGFGQSALKWSQESSTYSSSKSLPQSLSINGVSLSPEWLLAREAINLAFLQGNIAEATRLLVNFSPGILDRHAHLKFIILQQQLIEMIRQDLMDESLAFAHDLLQFAKQDAQILEELERTMALFALGKDEGGERVL